MKVVCRGDILGWFGNPTLPCPPMPTRDISDRAKEIQQLARSGSVRYAEPFLAHIVDRVAAIGSDGQDRQHARDLLDRIRDDLIRPRSFSEEQWPYYPVQEQLIVLPQYNRLRVEKIVRGPGTSLFLLGLDYRETGERDEDGSVQTDLYWRLFHFDSERNRVQELKGLPIIADGRQPLLLNGDQGDLYILSEQQLYCLTPDAELHVLGRLQIPEYSEETRPYALAVHRSHVLLILEEHGEEMMLYGFDLDGNLTREFGYVGNLVGAMELATRHGQLMISNLLDVRTINVAGAGSRSRDFKLYFEEFPFSATELLTEDCDGRIYFSNGSKVLQLSPEFDTIVDEFVLPQPIVGLLMDSEDEMRTVTRDALSNTLTIHSFRRR